MGCPVRFEISRGVQTLVIGGRRKLDIDLVGLGLE